MKVFNCYKCGCYVGEMTTGKFHKEAITLCKKCKKYIDDILNISNTDTVPIKDEDIVENLRSLFNMR